MHFDAFSAVKTHFVTTSLIVYVQCA